MSTKVKPTGFGPGGSMRVSDHVVSFSQNRAQLFAVILLLALLVLLATR